MYQKFYNFSAEPFRLSPEHGFAYGHKGFTKARAYLDYAFMRAEGFVMITGRPGTGKTTLIEALVDDLVNSPVRIANLVCTQLQADDLLKMVAYEFGIPVSVEEKGKLLELLTKQLKTWYRDGRRALLIVDEAQDLSISAMEELRLLTNIQMDSQPLLQIFLLGQPELRELILTPQLEQVHQRIIAASHLQPLKQDDTEAYIRHRLKIVGWQDDPAISMPVYPLVYKFSEGVPRRINLICSRLLLHCAVEERHRVTVADVREVVQELQSEKLASGDGFSESDFQVEDVFEEAETDVVNKETDVVNKTVPEHLGSDSQVSEVADLTQRRAASQNGQPALVPESRRKPVKNPEPGIVPARKPQATRQEANQKSLARQKVNTEAVTAESAPGQSVKNSAPAVDTPRAPKATRREVKKKSRPPLAVKADEAPLKPADSASSPAEKKSRSASSVLMLVADCMMLLLLVAGILIVFTSWI